MTKIYYTLSFFLILTIVLSDLSAQVTIGMDEVPVKGALLDIKQMEPSDPKTNNITSTKGGLGLPRVELQDIYSLKPMVSDTDDANVTLKKNHTGLMVYNLTNDPQNKLYLGVYVWVESVWKKLYEATGKFSLRFNPNTSMLIFPSGRTSQALVPQNLQIIWEPAIIPCNLLLNPLLNGGVTGFTPPEQTNKTGTHMFSIGIDSVPQALINRNLFYERSSVLSVTNLSERGEVNTASIVLKQINYALRVKGFKPYMVLGRTYNIDIASNTNWELKVTDNDNVIQTYNIPASNNNANKEGDRYQLTLKNQPELEGKKFTLAFSNPDGKFATQIFEIEVTPEYPNSYIVVPGQTISIPVKKAYISWMNELKESIPDSPLTAELVWQDEKSLISNVAIPTGKGVNAKFAVTTTNNTGNAVVALKINGVIYWSWHLWVINYNPDSAIPNPNGATPVTGGNLYSYNNGLFTSIFMDRNLGAKTIALNDYRAQGLQYQWGRKDPIQGKTDFNGPSQIIFEGVPIYNMSNTILTYGNPTGGTGFNFVPIPIASDINLKNAIENPMNYYVGSGNNDDDWYCNELGVHNPELWMDHNNHKTDYDPCPKGWRVPYSAYEGEYASPWQGLPVNAPFVQNNIDWTAEGAGLYPFIVNRDGAGRFIASTGAKQVTANSIVPGLNNSISAVPYNYIIPVNSSYGTSYPVRCVKDK